MSSISADVRPYAKEILLALCFLSALPAIVNRSADIVGAVPHAGYLVLLIILWGGLLGAAYTSPAFLRWTTAFLLAGTAYYMIVFERVTTEFMNYDARSEEHTSELQSLMRISYAVLCLKKKNYK